MKAEERDKTVKITFISNFLGPHQLPFCKAMVNRLGEDFKFVATEPMTEERIKLGWSLDKDTYPFEIKANESNELQKKAEQLAIESDVVIIGSAPDSYIIPRLKRNKLTFKYSERPLKKGIHWNNLAHIICGMWLHHGRFQSKPLYMLAASAYTADDYARFGCYRGKCYKWGYFPEAKKYDTLPISKIIDEKLGVIDLTATIMCLENKMPLAVFGLNEKNSIENLMKGEFNGTYVTV